jgi:hypothetical protein
MDHSQDNHVTLAQLQAFDCGQLPPAERGPIERHLDVCPRCCGVLDALPEGALEVLLRAFAGPTDCPGLTIPVAGGGATPLEIPAALVGHPRYRVLEVLGAGGMGVVYKAVHRLMERVVALKVLNQALTARPGFTERFHREVRAAARLAHPNIVTAYDAEEAAGTHFLVMEYVAGTSLDREVARRGPLPVREVCDLVRQAALGLQHAYERGMVHCDIKPHNLMLVPSPVWAATDESGVGQVKILDFGLARVLGEDGAALPSGTLVGTPDYVAPEQARDPSRADIRADIYSLGCTLYHLLTGRPPFPPGTTLQTLLAHQQCSPPPLAAARDDVPEALTRILDRMLAKDSARRYPTPADVAADLARLAGPATAALIAAPQRSSRRPLILAAAVLAVAGLLALVALLALPPLGPATRSADTAPGGAADSRPAKAPPASSGVVTDAKELARQKRKVRDQAVDWLRANNVWQPDHSIVGYVADHIDRDLAGSEAFQVLLGPLLVKSSKPTLLVGRAGTLHVFELGPALARDIAATGCRMQNYSPSDDRRRAAPRVLLSALVIDGAERPVPQRPLTGALAYRIIDRWPGGYALRLTFYAGKRRRYLFLHHARLPATNQGTLRFSFPPLDDPDQVMAGPDVVFVEVVTRGAAGPIVESNAVAAVVRLPSEKRDRSSLLRP